MMMFNPLKPTDFGRLKHFFEDQPWELCSYTLASIVAWSSEYLQTGWYIDGETLIIGAESSTNYADRHLILPLAPGRLFTPAELAGLAQKAGFETYQFVPGRFVKEQRAQDLEAFFHIAEQTAYEDYIYLTEDLAGLKGNRFSKKRNLIRQFERSYLARGRVAVEPITAAETAECLEFLDKWCADRNCEEQQNETLYCEKLATQQTIRNIELLESTGIQLRLDGQVAAFGISAKLTADMGVLHFEKALNGVKGLYQYFDRECARRLFSGYRYINKESDMNDAGLAKAKKSYFPVKMEKSYKLTLKSSA